MEDTESIRGGRAPGRQRGRRSETGLARIGPRSTTRTRTRGHSAACAWFGLPSPAPHPPPGPPPHASTHPISNPAACRVQATDVETAAANLGPGAQNVSSGPHVLRVHRYLGSTPSNVSVFCAFWCFQDSQLLPRLELHWQHVKMPASQPLRCLGGLFVERGK